MLRLANAVEWDKVANPRAREKRCRRLLATRKAATSKLLFRLSARALSICGLHTGEIDVLPHDISGIAVNIAARIVSLAQGGQVLVSSTVRDLVAGSGLRFIDQGARALKGIPDELRVFSVAES
jgi:class 3 adenylate cyclase